jgi:ATP/maltotriose-dependent transcriptional regulator MalT
LEECAPPGFGKTTALVNYLRHLTSKEIYCSLASEADAAGVWAAPLELTLDCEGVPDSGGVLAIMHLMDEAPEGVSLRIACRSRAAFDAGRLVTRGMASLCDAERLAFDAAQVAYLARV